MVLTYNDRGPGGASLRLASLASRRLAPRPIKQHEIGNEKRRTRNELTAFQTIRNLFLRHRPLADHLPVRLRDIHRGGAETGARSAV